jgi:nucleoside-diphosphate-sugar epimerase
MVDGINKLMFLDNLGGEVVNLGNPNEITILELAKIVKKLSGSSSEITFKPMPKDDPRRRKPKVDKAKKLLGWAPKVRLEDGLRETIKYFKKELPL